MSVHVKNGLTYSERNQQLLERWAQGEREVESEIIQNNLSLIKSLVRKYSRNVNDNEDLFQVGCLEMYRALYRYNVEKGSNFSTFVQTTVVGAIRKYYRDKVALVRLPRSEWELRTKIAKFMASYYEEYFKNPTVFEISEHFQLDIAQVSDILHSFKNPKSLDITVKDDENALEYHNLKINSLTQAIEQTNPEDKIMIEAAMILLSERERTLLHEYYFEGYTQTEIAKKHGLSQISVSRTLKKAVLQMKQTLTETS